MAVPDRRLRLKGLQAQRALGGGGREYSAEGTHRRLCLCCLRLVASSGGGQWKRQMRHRRGGERGGARGQRLQPRQQRTPPPPINAAQNINTRFIVVRKLKLAPHPLLLLLLLKRQQATLRALSAVAGIMSRGVRLGQDDRALTGRLHTFQALVTNERWQIKK